MRLRAVLIAVSLAAGMLTNGATNVPVASANDSTPRGWRLPFTTAGHQIRVSQAPGVNGHNGALVHDIDYAPTFGTNPPVYAPADGQVVFAGVDGGFGNSVRVNHSGIISLHAHLSAVSVTLGQQVDAGTQLGLMGTTGNSSGVHLHFGARSGASGVPILSIPGNWWYDCYVPLPATKECPLIGGATGWQGVAEYPATRFTPSWATGPVRHLSSPVSPPAVPSVYSTHYTNLVVDLNLGGNRNDPALTASKTKFQIQRYNPASGWQFLAGTWNPAYSIARLQAVDDYAVFAWNPESGWSPWGSVELTYADSVLNKPHFAIWKNAADSTGTLEYVNGPLNWWNAYKWNWGTITLPDCYTAAARPSRR